MKVWDIQWDVDYPEDLDNLPEEVLVPEDVYLGAEDKEEAMDIVSDWLSDEYGFCLYGFKCEF